MDITKKMNGDITIFEVSGKLDVLGSRKAESLIITEIPKGGKLILDMSGCDYVASSGLRILLLVAKQAKTLGCNAVIAGVQPMVWDVIVMTGFEDVLTPYATQQDALTVLGG